MNPQRYIMPVLIAAGLHGALLLFSSPGKPPAPAPDPGLPFFHTTSSQIEMSEPVEDSADGGGGKADPLPVQADIPKPLTSTDIFTIQIKTQPEALRPVTNLPVNTTGLIGPNEEGWRGSAPKGILDATKLDRAPRATVQTAPNYPETMRSSATNGSVTVEFVVDTSGRVLTAEAVRWTHREFVNPAVQAVLRWRFEPGTNNGRKVNFRMAIPMMFVATN